MTVSQIWKTSSSLWLTNSTERPSFFSLSTTRKSRSASFGVIDAVGSSSSSTRLSTDSAFAISTSCAWATDSSVTGLSGSMSRSSSASHRLASERMAARSTSPREVGSFWSRMFSPTVKPGIRLRSWCTTPIPADADSCGDPNCTSLPSSSNRPPSGL